MCLIGGGGGGGGGVYMDLLVYVSVELLIILPIFEDLFSRCSSPHSLYNSTFDWKPYPK